MAKWSLKPFHSPEKVPIETKWKNASLAFLMQQLRTSEVLVSVQNPVHVI